MRPRPFPRPASRRLLLAGAALSLAAGSASALEPDKLFEKVSRSVVLVLNQGERGLQATGSGVVVGPQRIVTNCHVLRRAKQVEVKLGNARYGTQLLYPDVERDLCMLEVKDLAAPALDIAPLTGVRVGQKVYAVGAPRGLELTLSDGLVSSIRTVKGNDQLIQTSAPISHGSSGGGLFDEGGRLVGITSGVIEAGQNLNFAVPAEYIRELPERGQAALQKYRQQQQQAPAPASAPGGTEAPPAPGASARPPAAASSRTERPLTADELSRHLSAVSEFSGQLSNGTMVKFEWTWGNGFAVASEQSSDRITGTRTLQGAQVCLRQANASSYRPSDLSPLSGNECYDVLQTGAKSFVWRGRRPADGPVLSYTLP